MKTDGFFSKMNVQTLIFLGVFALFFILVARLFMPFFTIILWAAILYVLIDPLYVRLSGIRKAKLTGKTPSSFRRPGWAALGAGGRRNRRSAGLPFLSPHSAIQPGAGRYPGLR
jgi:hypothetical protein